MPVMGLVKFERLFRAVGGVTVDRDDVNRYLDFVNDAIYDLMVTGRATAKANVRDVIEPWDLPITKGLQESLHQLEKLEEEIELQPILESLTARPPLDVTLDEETEARLPLIFGGISDRERADYRATAQGHGPACRGHRMRRSIPGSRFRTGGAAGYWGGAPADADGRGGIEVEDAVEGYGDTALPWLAETAGFCGALLLVDWNSGHSISETIWDSPKTLAAI
jgi:Domain of unknown function (DUF1931)